MKPLGPPVNVAWSMGNTIDPLCSQCGYYQCHVKPTGNCWYEDVYEGVTLDTPGEYFFEVWMVWCLIGRQVGLEGVQMTSSQQVLGCQGPRVMKPHLLIPEIRTLRPAISCRNLGTPENLG